MATTFYDSGYYSTSPSISRKSSDSAPPMSTPTSILDGLEFLPVHPFKNVKQLRKAVQAATERLSHGSGQQYMVFGPVKAEVAQKLNDSDKSLGSGAKMGYDEATERLIAKLALGLQHEAFSVNIATDITRKLDQMGLHPRAFIGTGAATYKASNSSKQPDVSFRPATRKGTKAAPSIVFEAGWAESLPQLRKDAAYWLTNSNNEVNIVILMSIRGKTKTLIIEKWILDVVQGGTRTRPTFQKMPVKKTEVSIRPGTEGPTAFITTGEPLILEFESLLDRPPVPPESDVIFSAADLSSLAAAIWGTLENEEEGQAEESSEEGAEI